MKNSLFNHGKVRSRFEKICAGALMLALNISVLGTLGMSAEVTYAAEPAVTIVVSPANMNGWSFANETPNGGGTFVIGPMFQPLGLGSAQLNVDMTGRQLFGTRAYGNTPLASFTALSYSSHADFTAPDLVTTSLMLDIDANIADGIMSGDGRLVYEPHFTHAVIKSLWQNWNTQDNAVGGSWWLESVGTTNPCPQADPCTWSEVLTAFPGAGIREGGMIQFLAGGPSASLVSVYADNLTIEVPLGMKTYDFDPSPTVTVLTETACADSVDNDNDGMTDLFDEDCAALRPVLHIVKQLINNNGGTSTLADFSYHWRVAINEEDFAMPLGQLDLVFPFVGEYTITEDAVSGYSTTYSSTCTGTTTVGQASTTCTITNDDIGTTTENIPVDLCPNILGNQEAIPDGMILSEGQCVMTPPVVIPPVVVLTPVVSGGGSATFDYWGCTNPAATNFNSLANKDDGSCARSGNTGDTTSTTSTSSGGMIPPTANFGGEVLGAGTTTTEFTLPLPPACSAHPYLLEYMKMGMKNDPEHVRALQVFLNEEMEANLPVSGHFGTLTKQWVKKFQKKHHAEILKPWIDAGYVGDLSDGTGYVYKTTIRFINILRCTDGTTPTMPDLSDDLKNII